MIALSLAHSAIAVMLHILLVISSSFHSRIVLAKQLQMLSPSFLQELSVSSHPTRMFSDSSLS